MNNIVEIEASNKTDALAKNLRMLLKKHQANENEIARALNIPVMTIRRLASGETIDPRISTLKLIADYFGISVDMLIENNLSTSIAAIGKAVPQFIPLLDWNKASAINSIADIDLTTWNEWHPVILGDQSLLSTAAFALESRPSMQPRFSLGTLFVIEPNESPADGDLVLIKLKTDGSVSLRELIVDSPRSQLQPIITGSEVLFYDETYHQIVGVVVLSLLHARKDKSTR